MFPLSHPSRLFRLRQRLSKAGFSVAQALGLGHLSAQGTRLLLHGLVCQLPI